MRRNRSWTLMLQWMVWAFRGIMNMSALRHRLKSVFSNLWLISEKINRYVENISHGEASTGHVAVSERSKYIILSNQSGICFIKLHRKTLANSRRGSVLRKSCEQPSAMWLRCLVEAMKKAMHSKQTSRRVHLLRRCLAACPAPAAKDGNWCLVCECFQYWVLLANMLTGHCLLPLTSLHNPPISSQWHSQPLAIPSPPSGTDQSFKFHPYLPLVFQSSCANCCPGSQDLTFLKTLIKLVSLAQWYFWTSVVRKKFMSRKWNKEATRLYRKM